MPITNVSSVLEHGILSHENCSQLEHTDVSMAEIQDKRDKKNVPGGYRLHQYANLYFHARNPMMYKRKGQAENLCVLRFSHKVLEIEGVVITDQNASSDYVKFMTPDHLSSLNFGMIYADDWRHPDDRIAQWKHSSAKCAEVLIPNGVHPSYIVGAYVSSSNALEKLREQNFNLPIELNANIFFCER